MKLRPMKWDNYARGICQAKGGIRIPAFESFFALSEEGEIKIYLSIELQCQGSYAPNCFVGLVLENHILCAGHLRLILQ